MEDIKEIDADLRAKLDEYVKLKEDAEIHKFLYEKTVAKLLELGQQISEAVAPELTPEKLFISYAIEETHEFPTRGRKRKEPDKDFRYMVANLSPKTDEHGLSMYVSRSIRILSEDESHSRFLQQLLEELERRKSENPDPG
ncbi:hypothetical protein NIES2135_05130 [Leptolyngbya boryana NIES-2135]|jgi:hypothetical protein|uniref:Uncharacterized protein n=1 Tax=Leptolyngbya boryana NIES-2135 TaxID=1973484 RepID=A0A1Z4JAG5_LEPBY|nr:MULTISPECIES: hypothetical protein [Leptolyngbya]BAY53703.1 hypothetical protein NIES2135_05130 [Leptolyngbya boryana NIES-2135]MBD2367856.1 hypothetical protein [Leptolyngbya sp. FACHB-161]MBD2374296.1 hypothetical protein [Leptolyngbya sp. FACHB-238]MBD2398518.1 hypothetical protein [Leptolyngbya sp. FACHB-239]MBD2406220.1 hypothetical protein [Leptolyngbya sp. FACHB-402]